MTSAPAPCPPHTARPALRLTIAALISAMTLTLSAPEARAQFLETHGDATIPLQPVPQLEPERYAGRWYEIARFPNRYQRNCEAVVADYAARNDGNYDVRGFCPERRAGREAGDVSGVARIDGPGELSVGVNSWMPFFRRSIFVLGISPDYEVVVIGEPRRKYGWVMARGREMSLPQRDFAFDILTRNGYETELLEYPQFVAEP